MKTLALLAVFLIPIFGFSKDRPEVTQTMHDAFNSLMDLQTYAVDAKRFQAKSSREKVSKNLEVLSKIQHAFPEKMKNEEPGAAAIVSLFQSYLKDVKERYKSGDYEYARHRIQSAGGFCFACHSRMTSNMNFEDFSRKVEKLDLSKFKKAETFAATRQFDKALSLYNEVLATPPNDGLAILEYARSLRHALNITVRVKRNAEKTDELLNQVLKRKDLPEFIVSMVKAWQKDTKQWIKEQEGPANLSADDLLLKARTLVERAASLQSFPADEYGDISYLRATSYLHEALDNNPKGSFRPEALYYLGLSYKALQDPLLWDLDKIYFETCILEFPKAPIAKKCYRRYAEVVSQGYTGSGGTFLPEDELEKIIRYRKMTE